MNLLEAMRIITDKYHNQIMGQKRKYTGEKYTVHTNAVEQAYGEYAPKDIVGRAAAEANDLFEDTTITENLLIKELNNLGIIDEYEIYAVITLIQELSDVYTKEKYPNLKRQERKRLENERLATVSYKAQEIKIFDLEDNTKSIVEYDKKFARVYLVEKWNLLQVLTKANPVLLERAKAQTVLNFKYLNIPFPV